MQINPEKSFAIMIGIHEYLSDELHDLDSVYENLSGVTDIITKGIGIPVKNRKWLTDVSRSDIVSYLKDLVDREPWIENLIIYFSRSSILVFFRPR
jgi:hypothetical protein